LKFNGHPESEKPDCKQQFSLFAQLRTCCFFCFSKKTTIHPVKPGILIFAAPSLGPVPILYCSCQNRHKISQTVSFQHNRTPLYLYGSWATQNIKQHLHTLFCWHDTQNKRPHPGKRPIHKNHFIRWRNTIFNRHGVVSLKTLPQFLNDRIRDGGNLSPKMHEAANSNGVPNVAKILFKHTANENVARKQWFHDTHYTALSCSLYAQPGMKYFQTEVLAHVGCGDVLMLWLGSRAIPSQGTVNFILVGTALTCFPNRAIQQSTAR
jgi:hypothetical protein